VVGRRNEGQNQNKCLAAKIQDGIAQKPATHTGLLGLGIIHRRAWSLVIRTATILVPKEYLNLDEPEDAIRYVPCCFLGFGLSIRVCQDAVSFVICPRQFGFHSPFKTPYRSIHVNC